MLYTEKVAALRSALAHEVGDEEVDVMFARAEMRAAMAGYSATHRVAEGQRLHRAQEALMRVWLERH